jgi:hypothetical protein
MVTEAPAAPHTSKQQASISRASPHPTSVHLHAFATQLAALLLANHAFISQSTDSRVSGACPCELSALSSAEQDHERKNTLAGFSMDSATAGRMSCCCRFPGSSTFLSPQLSTLACLRPPALRVWVVLCLAARTTSSSRALAIIPSVAAACICGRCLLAAL